MALLKKHLCADNVPHTILEIGGGFGTLGEVLSYSGISDLRYIDVDIPPVSFVAQYYLSEVLGDINETGYANTREQLTIEIYTLPQALV